MSEAVDVEVAAEESRVEAVEEFEVESEYV